jgi:hypothetical protein
MEANFVQTDEHPLAQPSINVATANAPAPQLRPPRLSIAAVHSVASDASSSNGPRPTAPLADVNELCAQTHPRASTLAHRYDVRSAFNGLIARAGKLECQMQAGVRRFPRSATDQRY